MVELMVVLTILSILAALAGGGLSAYARLARFRRNEANARTVFQIAQIALSHKEMAGELDSVVDGLIEASGKDNGNFTEADASDDAELERNTLAKKNENIYAVYLDKDNPDAASGSLIRELLEPYTADPSLLNAAICLEIDSETNQVYSAFYDSVPNKLRFGATGDAVEISDRSYDHRRHESLVGYYSAEDRVNVVVLDQIRLKVQNLRLVNTETLTLNWNSNSRGQDLDTVFTATILKKDTDTPLLNLEISRYDKLAGSLALTDVAEIKVTKYVAGVLQDTPEIYRMPLTYGKNGTFTLTLDAMADADLLRSCENEPDAAPTSLFSITRLIKEPQDIYVSMKAEQREGSAGNYQPSNEKKSNTENTLFAQGAELTATGMDDAKVQYFRHLYNLRWVEKFDAGTGNKYEFKLVNDAKSRTRFDWTNGDVVVYTMPEDGGKIPVAQTPKREFENGTEKVTVVAWPTILELPANVTVVGEPSLVLGNVRISHLQLRENSVSKTAKNAAVDETPVPDAYVGLVGANHGTIEKINFYDVDVAVNVRYQAENTTLSDPDVTITGRDDADPNAVMHLMHGDLYPLDHSELPSAADMDDPALPYRKALKGVGVVCGLNRGELRSLTLDGTKENEGSKVFASLYVDGTTTDADDPHGFGGIVGVAMPEKSDGTSTVMKDLQTKNKARVAGVLVDGSERTKGTWNGELIGDPNDDNAVDTNEEKEKVRYRLAVTPLGESDENPTIWRAAGVGGLVGTWVAEKDTDETHVTGLKNDADVTGNALTGGVVGNLICHANTAEDYATLKDLRNNGLVLAGANYLGDEAGQSPVLGQFFGGVAGYARGVKLDGCESTAKTSLDDIRNGFTVSADKTKVEFNENSPLRGDFVGGIVGFGHNIHMQNCQTGVGGYVLGRRFVGGMAGGTSSDADTSNTIENATNNGYVIGNRYVGGIVAVNGAGSTVKNATTQGIATGVGPEAAFVGGIAGVNDASWGVPIGEDYIAQGKDYHKMATLDNCVNNSGSNTKVNANNIEMLNKLAGEDVQAAADFVGGLVGWNGLNAVVDCTQTLNAVVYGRNFVGGALGYNATNAGQLTVAYVTGRVVGEEDCVGGLVGLNRAHTLPAATVAAEYISGRNFVGGVIGANMPTVNDISNPKSFTVTEVTDSNGNQKSNLTTKNTGTGQLRANAFAGGIIGFHQTFKDSGILTTTEHYLNDKYPTRASWLKEMLVPELDQNNCLILKGKSFNAVNAQVTLDSCVNELSVYANAMAGGILGTAAPRSILVIENAVNKGSLYRNEGEWGAESAKGGVNVTTWLKHEWQDTLKDHPDITLDESRLPQITNAECALVGGIVGVNARSTVINCCENRGTILGNTKGVGGLAGMNEGMMLNSGMHVSLGAPYDNYHSVGGIAGVNAAWQGGTDTTGVVVTLFYQEGSGTHVKRLDEGVKRNIEHGVIQNCSVASGMVVRGGKRVGGLVGTNLKGAIVRQQPLTQDSANQNVNYLHTLKVLGIEDVGGLVGRNEGQIENATITSTVSANAAKSNAGGVAGVNTGIIQNMTLLGGVTAQTTDDCVGGVAGVNYGKIYDVEVHSSNITAIGRYAGGAVGRNQTHTGWHPEGALITQVKVQPNGSGKVLAQQGYAGGLVGYNAGGDENNGASYTNATVTKSIAIGYAPGAPLTVQAASGMAGGMVAANAGIVDGCAYVSRTPAPSTDGKIMYLTVEGTHNATGVVAAVNDKGGVITGEFKLSAESPVKFEGNATLVGGVAGQNYGTIGDESATTRTCLSVETANKKDAYDGWNVDRLSSNALTVGGIAGRNEADAKIIATDAGKTQAFAQQLNITTGLSKIRELGGVVGINDGTLDQCTYQGVIGDSNILRSYRRAPDVTDGQNRVPKEGAKTQGDRVGGLVALNNGEISNSRVRQIRMAVQGVFAVLENDDAALKLQKSSHVGGLVGENAEQGKMVSCYINTETSGDGANDWTNLIVSQYGFLGGVAGSNSGSIDRCGDEDAFTVTPSGKQPLIDAVNGWLAETQADGTTALTDEEKNRNLNAMIETLKGDTYQFLRGVKLEDTRYTDHYNNWNFYKNSRLGINKLNVVLRGNFTTGGKGNGYLGGIVGFNTPTGTLNNSANGKWIVYADNLDAKAAVGGVIGQNESDRDMKTVINCAAVRRFTRTINGDAGLDNKDRQSFTRYVQVGGLVGQQQNRTSDRWSMVNFINYGSVYNSGSSNVGGVIGYWVAQGGTLKRCFNFGDLIVNANGNVNDGVGTIGGIAAYFDNPTPGSAVNILSCQNHGNILATNNDIAANDCAGILGKVQMQNSNDEMTLNIVDCVNGRGKIQARSLACGIMAWLGPSVVNNVQVNIDRCRNFSTDFTGPNTLNEVGIYGNRGDGSASIKKTVLTNCFALDQTPEAGKWYPICYWDKMYKGEGNCVEYSNNFYVDNQSFGGNYNKNLLSMKRQIVPGATSQYNGKDKEDTDSQRNKNSGTRLYLGVDGSTNAGDADHYFAARLTETGTQRLNNIHAGNSYIAAAGDGFTNVENPRYISDGNGNSKADLLLLFGEKGVNQKPSFEDITDEIIQAYYRNILESDVPTEPKNLEVKYAGEGVTDQGSSIYGVYEATWEMDAGHNASSYKVELLVKESAGSNIYVKAEGAEYTVYEKRCQFTAPPEYIGKNFIVKVWAQNSKGLSADCATSDPLILRGALPTPELEVRPVPKTYMKNAGDAVGLDGNPNDVLSMLVLKNAKEYCELNVDLTVEATVQGYDHKLCFVFRNGSVDEINYTDPSNNWAAFAYFVDRYTGEAMVAMPSTGLDRILKAVAKPGNADGNYMDSRLFDATATVPNQNQPGMSLPQGTLKASIQTSGNTIADMTINATYSLSGCAQSTLYHVALMGKYKLDDLKVGDQSLNGQYITVAYKDVQLNTDNTVVTFESLPRDLLQNFDTDSLRVVAVPLNSGKGPYTTTRLASETEVTEALGKLDNGKTILESYGLEVVRNEDGTLSYNRNFAMQYLSAEGGVNAPNVNAPNGASKPCWQYVCEGDAEDGTNKRIDRSDLGVTILPGPTLSDTAEGALDPDTNDLLYTFTWKQTKDNTEGGDPVTNAKYEVTFYGITKDDEGKDVAYKLPLKNDADMKCTHTENGNYTLTLNVDNDLQNGSTDWRYHTVRLEVVRIPTDTDGPAVGAASMHTYENIVTRLEQPMEPSTVIATDLEDASSLPYEIEWMPINLKDIDNQQLDHYEVFVQKANKVETDPETSDWVTLTVFKWSTLDTANSLSMDLEQLQGETLRFYVVACAKVGQNLVVNSPNGLPGGQVTVKTRVNAPQIGNAAFGWTAVPTGDAKQYPTQEEFVEALSVNYTMGAQYEEGRELRATGYLFNDKDAYDTVKGLAAAWQTATPNTTARDTALDNLQNALNTALSEGKAIRTIAENEEQLGVELEPGEKRYELPSNAYVPKPEHARQYLLTALRTMTTTEEDKISSNWYWYLPEQEQKLRLPAIQLDQPQANKDNYEKVNMPIEYSMDGVDAGYSGENLDVERTTVEWELVNEYTDTTTGTRNLTDTYETIVVPVPKLMKLDEGAVPPDETVSVRVTDAQESLYLAYESIPYRITVTVADRDIPAGEGTEAKARGDILSVTKQLLTPVLTERQEGKYELGYAETNGEPVPYTGLAGMETAWPLNPAEDGSYDLSVLKVQQPNVDDDQGNPVYTEKSYPSLITGQRTTEEATTPYYRIYAVPELMVKVDPTTNVKKLVIVLPDLKFKVPGDQNNPLPYTASVAVRALGEETRADIQDADAKTRSSERPNRNETMLHAETATWVAPEVVVKPVQAQTEPAAQLLTNDAPAGEALTNGEPVQEETQTEDTDLESDTTPDETQKTESDVIPAPTPSGSEEPTPGNTEPTPGNVESTSGNVEPTPANTEPTTANTESTPAVA